MELQQRTVAQVVGVYRDQLTNFVYETLNGSMDAIDMRRAHREMIRRLGPSAYVEGLREGGIPAEELDAADRKAIQEWITSQSAYVNKFASDSVAARGDDGKRKQILSRLDMWIESMQVIGSQGLMSAQKNRMGTWRLGPTEKHCISKNGRIGCANLHGKRHRLSWFLSRGLIPRQPGSAVLGCKGFKCLCEIQADDGTTLVPTERAVRFDPNQPRDPEGKWSETGASSSKDNNPVGWTSVDVSVGDRFIVSGRDGEHILELQITHPDPFRRTHKAKISKIINSHPADMDVALLFMDREHGGQIQLMDSDIKYLTPSKPKNWRKHKTI